jgi:uncharacterized membrane protein YhaH (DUF805 family)
MFSGRINRESYLVGLGLCSIAGTIFFCFISQKFSLILLLFPIFFIGIGGGIFFNVILLYEIITFYYSIPDWPTLVTSVIFTLLLSIFVSSFILRRLHDLNYSTEDYFLRSTWRSIGNHATPNRMFFTKGEQYANKYGKAPQNKIDFGKLFFGEKMA